jgi:PIN domain nuclease of toxin-antitoxin system
MPDIVVDTHILIWSYTNSSRISANALSAILEAEADFTIHVSAISIVELIYLSERQRIDPAVLLSVYETLENPDTSYRLVELSHDIAKEVSEIPRIEIPEMPDRIISATARFLQIPLVTTDAKILGSEAIQTIW